MKKQFSEETLNSFRSSDPEQPDKLHDTVMKGVERELAETPRRIFSPGKKFLIGIAAVFVAVLTASVIISFMSSSFSGKVDRSTAASDKEIKREAFSHTKMIPNEKSSKDAHAAPDAGDFIGALGVGAGSELQPGYSIQPQSTLMPGWLGQSLPNQPRPVRAKDKGDADLPYDEAQTENEYGKFVENSFTQAMDTPFSTFSIDVDTASYSIMRRHINSGVRPPSDSVRIEEMINYFKYEYAAPGDGLPFSVNTEFGPCPWNSETRLILVGLQGKAVNMALVPPSNIVFLLDVSGSMGSEDKLPLLRDAFKILVENLRPQDRVAIVVYAGASGLVLPSTPGSDKATIIAALNSLQSGGSTAGGAGIMLAYSVAADNFIKGGNNRVILATDGDFNVGISSTEELVKLIENKREEGVFLSVLGFGLGNLKDSMMEQLADNGNGNYAYIDTIKEAERVFGRELTGTIFTIAKDVKLQIEFNPAKISKYRLIGYENRILKKEDFDNDAKDAGELGSGHCVTALYEVVLASAEETVRVRSKYTETKLSREALESDDLMTVNLRYKNPDENVSKLIEHPVSYEELGIREMSSNFRFAAAVTEFAQVLRNSAYKGTSNPSSALSIALSALNYDPSGYRREFADLVQKYIKIQ